MSFKCALKSNLNYMLLQPTMILESEESIKRSYFLFMVCVSPSLFLSGLAGGSGEQGPGDRDAGLEMVYSL